MSYVIKTRINAIEAAAFTFEAAKTMYGGRKVAVGDTIFLFASETPAAAASSVAALSRLPRAFRP